MTIKELLLVFDPDTEVIIYKESTSEPYKGDAWYLLADLVDKPDMKVISAAVHDENTIEVMCK